MGKAIIIPNISFALNNLGIVNFIDTINTLKITALENLTISFPNNLRYNTKKYPCWKYYEANTSLVIFKGTTVAFKGDLIPNENGIGTFNISGNCIVSGNIIGLVNNNQMREYEFKGLFKNCTTILDASELELPTDLEEGCYEEMFYGCTSLISAPKLKATSLVEKCYEKMFYNCSSLNNIYCYNLDDISDYVSSDWVYNVPQIGLFNIDFNGSWDSTNKLSHIPYGWHINNNYNKIFENEYFTIEIITDGKFTVLPCRQNYNTEFTSSNALTISYRINDGNWIETQLLDSGLTLDVVANDTIKFKGNNTHYCTNSGSNNPHKEWFVSFGTMLPSIMGDNNVIFKNTFINTTATFNVYGNIMSLLYGDNFIEETTLESDYAFCSLFKAANVISAKNLILPATTLSTNCYRAMFSYASNLTITPTIINTTVVDSAYKYMFEHCINLTQIICLVDKGINTNAFDHWTLYLPNTENITFIKNPNTTISTSARTSNWRIMSKSTIEATTGVSDNYGRIGSNWKIQDYEG